MNGHPARGVILATALALAMAGSTSAAAGWEMHDFETPLGDRRVALRVAAKRTSDVHLALARRLLRAEAESPTAEMTIEIPGVAGKPVALTFPLAGLKAKVGTLAQRCDDWDLEER